MSAIDKIRSHFDNMEMKKLSFPEMGLDVYVKPATVGDVQGIYSKIEKGDVAALANMCVRVARDENGEMLFKNTSDELMTLRKKCPLHVMNEIVSTAMEFHIDDETEKN